MATASEAAQLPSLGTGRRNHRRQDPLVRPACRLPPGQRRYPGPVLPLDPQRHPGPGRRLCAARHLLQLPRPGLPRPLSRCPSPSWRRCSSACCATSTADWTARSATTISCRSSAAPSATPPPVTYATCALHCPSYGSLYLALPPAQREPLLLLLTLVVLGWVTWASDAMARLLKRVGDHLGRLNAALHENQAVLEARIAERTRELQGGAGPRPAPGEDGRLRPAGRRHRPRGRQPADVDQLPGADAPAPRLRRLHSRQTGPGQRPAAAHPGHLARAGRTSAGRPARNAPGQRWARSWTRP